MAKRFRDTQLSSETWYRKLPLAHKALWSLLCDVCDVAGIWEYDEEFVTFSLGEKVDIKAFFEEVNKTKTRVSWVKGGKIFIIGFVEFQCGDLRPDSPPHAKIINILKKYNLFHHGKATLPDRVCDRVLDTLKEEEEEKEEENKGNDKKNQEPLPVGSELVQEVANAVWKDQIWKESVCMGNSIDMDQLKKWMAQYNASVSNDVIKNFNEASYKKMFGGWLNKQKGKGYTVESGVQKTASAPPLKRLLP